MFLIWFWKRNTKLYLQCSLRYISEKAMATHSSTLAWKILWIEEPGRLQSVRSLRLGHDFTFTFHFHALEKEMATHSCVLAWRIPGMGEPGRLPSMGSHRVGHDWSDLAAAADIYIYIYFLLPPPYYMPFRAQVSVGKNGLKGKWGK